MKCLKGIPLAKFLDDEIGPTFVGSLYYPRIGWAALMGTYWGNRLGQVLNRILAVAGGGFLGFGLGHSVLNWHLAVAILIGGISAILTPAIVYGRFPYVFVQGIIYGIGFIIAQPIATIVGLLGGSGDHKPVTNAGEWRQVGPGRVEIGMILLLAFASAVSLVAACGMLAWKIHRI